MPKRKINDDSDFEEHSADDDEWEEDGAAAAAEDDDDGGSEEDEWSSRRKRKPISPVRTRAARGSGKVTGPSRNRAVPVEQYKPQWIKKGSAQSGEGYGSQLRLIDYLGADKSLMNRFGYKGDKSSTSTAKKPSAHSSRFEKPEPEDEAFIDDGSDVEAPIQLDDEEDEEEDAELVFSDDDSVPRQQKKKPRRLRKKRDVVLALESNDEDEYNDDVEIVSTTTKGLGNAEAAEEENDEDEDEDLKRALRKSRMEMLRDRSRRRNEERETRQVLRVSTREAEKRKNPRSSRIEIGSDEDEAEEEEENGDEDEESDEDVAAVNNLLAKCESAADTLHSYLEQLQAAQTKGEVGQTDSGVTVLKQPHTIQRTLKSYQVAGLNWLYALHTQKLNGILADEMGLGKTVQTISLLAQLLLDGNRGPHIIIVPASTLHNWKKELASWCPALKVFIYYGNMAERSEMRVELKSVPDDYYNVWVTTYSVAQSKHDRSFLRKRKFKYMVLDEAQNIKNTSSQRYKSLFSLNSKNRLLLTGTPVENTMNELMALLYFLLPRLFGSARDYEELKVHLARAQKRSDLLESGFISRMKQIVTPFLLRRLKSEVSIELDPKKERIARCPMPDVQAQLYDDLLSRSKKHIAESTNREMEDASLALVEEVMDDEEPRPKAIAGTKKKPVPPSPKKLSNNTFMNICMQLIKMADHPLLLRSNYTDQKVREIAKLLKRYYPDEFQGVLSEVEEDLQLNSDFVIHQVVASRKKIPASYRLNLDNLWEASAKMEHLRTLLPELFAQDRRVLIFSLMTKMLDILEVFLEKIGYRFLRLDGSTPVGERQEMIDEFNTDLSIPIFLLSTKAGGLGINLTSADTVIFYDSSFNPQVDRQAEDRVHRLGQLKQVEIIRLVSENTIDEHILKMAEQKKKLSEALLAEGSYAAKNGSGPSAMDVKDILKVITASVHAPSPLANRPPAQQRAHSGAKPKPPVLFLDDADAADATTATTTSAGANGHSNSGRTTQRNGSHSTAESARKRKRIAAEEEDEDEEEEEDEEVHKETRDDKGKDRAKADVKDNRALVAEKEKANKRQKLEDEEPKTRTNGSAAKKMATTTSTEGGKKAEAASSTSSSTTSKAKPKQLTLEEFKRKYSTKS